MTLNENEQNFINALYYDNYDICESLIDKRVINVNLEYPAVWKISILQTAVENGNYRITKLLLQNGANVHHEDHMGRTPIFFAKDPKICNLLLNYGANINHRSSSGSTPLMGLCINIFCEKDIVIFLISRGADLSLKNKYGENIIQQRNNYNIKEYNEVTEILVTEQNKQRIYLQRKHLISLI